MKIPDGIGFMNKKLDISKIRIKFGGKNEPKDEKLIDLLKQAYSGNLLAKVALIKSDGIKPFSNYKPKISEEYRNSFENKEKQGSPPPIYVYPSNDFFIMSDDYRAYFLYKEKKYTQIMCILLGDSDSKFIIEKSESFKLPAPKVEVIKRSG